MNVSFSIFIFSQLTKNTIFRINLLIDIFNCFRSMSYGGTDQQGPSHLQQTQAQVCFNLWLLSFFLFNHFLINFDFIAQFRTYFGYLILKLA